MRRLRLVEIRRGVGRRLRYARLWRLRRPHHPLHVSAIDLIDPLDVVVLVAIDHRRAELIDEPVDRHAARHGPVGRPARRGGVGDLLSAQRVLRGQLIAAGEGELRLLEPAVVHQAIGAVLKEDCEFIGGRQRLEIPALLEFGVADRVGPLAIVGIRMIVEAGVGALDVESLGAIVPSGEDVRLGQDQTHRVAEPTPDGDVHDRHRGAGAPVGVVDHAVEEGVPGIGKVAVSFAAVMVVDAEIFLEHRDQQQDAELGLGIPELGGGLAKVP